MTTRPVPFTGAAMLAASCALLLCSCAAAARPAKTARAAAAPKTTVAASATAASAAYTVPHVHPDFDPSRVSFQVGFNGIESSWNTMSAFVMPGGTLEFAASGGSGSFTSDAGGGRLKRKGPASWAWTAPSQHGDHAITVRDERSGEEILLRVFVLHPYDGGDRVGSYRVGRYQKKPKDDDPAYNRPEGFVEVTERNLDAMLTPHFRLSQFVCKAESDFPKYVALRTELLVKLETLLEALARRGLPAQSLHVMSGYRTPAHNARIGNETTYSRHTYGDAADVFLDRDNDGQQDDLDEDGRVTLDDARVLYQLVEDTLDQSLPPQMVGGLSVYARRGDHGPFIHIDTRGKRVRW